MKHIFRHKLGSVAITVLMAAGLSCAATSCRSKSDVSRGSEAEVKANPIESRVHFDSDSAYSYVRAQVAFGPRVAGSEEGRRCARYIESELRRHGADEVLIQDGTVEAWNGDKLDLRNVMGRFNPGAKKRVLLVAHYDTRPWADSDETEENRLRPVPGANDGASGVGVLLEIARQLGEEKAPVGVDLLFVDAEDYGRSSGFSHHEDSWCLGTQYWINHMPYSQTELPEYGVLLDMVGGMNAKFHREFYSDNNASELLDKVWDIADRSGYGDKFINKPGGAVVDDHLFLCRAGIPTIDIIESKNDDTKTFPATWHTVNDNMRYIDRSSLKAAGQTVVNLIYQAD